MTPFAVMRLRNPSDSLGSFFDEVMSDSPVHYFRLGETSGTAAANDGSNGTAGTYTGGFTLNEASLIDGDADPSISLNGSSGRVEVATAPAFMDEDCTLIILVKPTGSGSRGLVSCGEAGFYARLNGSGELQIISSQTALIATSTGSIANDTRAILGITISPEDSGTWDWTIYIDGAPDSSGTTSTALAASALHLGCDYVTSPTPGPSEFWSGQLDEIAMFAQELDATRMLAFAEAAGLA